MKSIAIGIVFILGLCTVMANPSTIEKSGKCKLQKAGAFDKKKFFILDLKNSDAEVKCEFRGGDFFNKFALFGIPKVTNLSKKPFNMSYNVAFFDKSGKLITTVRQDWDNVKADAKEFQMGSALSSLPEAAFKKITSYKLVIYISEAKK